MRLVLAKQDRVGLRGSGCVCFGGSLVCVCVCWGRGG
jgi:hypothetical protein